MRVYRGNGSRLNIPMTCGCMVTRSYAKTTDAFLQNGPNSCKHPSPSVCMFFINMCNNKNGDRHL